MTLKPVSELEYGEGIDEIARRADIDPSRYPAGVPVAYILAPLAAMLGIDVPDLAKIQQGDVLRWLRVLDGEALPEDKPADDITLLILNPSVGLARARDLLQRADHLAMVEGFNLPRQDIEKWRGDVGRYVWDVMLGMKKGQV